MGTGIRPPAPALGAPAIRRARPEDIPAVVALERACFGDPWPASAFVDLPGHEHVHFSVAEAGDEVIGYSVAWYVLDEGELANLAVAPGHRKSGVGRELLATVLADARARGVTRIHLEVRESNDAARQLYARNGFAEVGRRRGYYRKPTEDGLILRLTIEPREKPVEA